jgi:hypothetical protein
MRGLKIEFAEIRRSCFLLLLNRLQVLDQVLQANLAEILVVLDLVKDRTPHGHLARSVRLQRRIIAGDELLDLLDRKFAAVVLGQQGEVRGLGLQSGRGRTIALSANAVTGRAVRVKQVGALHRIDQLLVRFGGRRLRLRDGCIHAQ